MSITHELFAIMEFMDCAQWQSDLQDVMDGHFAMVFEELDVEFEDLGGLLGKHWQTTLWNCAFEDALSLEFNDNRNPVDEYLKRPGIKETAQTEAYLKALRTSVMSLYEVSEIVPGQSFLARDLLRGGDPILVQEMSATKPLRQWEKIAARIVKVPGKTILAGGMLPFSSHTATLLVENMAKALEKKPTRTKPLELDDSGLRSLTPLFTMTWLMDTLPKAAEIGLPEFCNRDGDSIIFHDVRFLLAEGVTVDQIASRLAGIADFEAASGSFWIWLDQSNDAHEEPTKAELDKHDPLGKAVNSDLLIEGCVPVLGNVELKECSLHLVANSVERAAAGISVLTDALGGLVGSPFTSVQTVEQMIADHGNLPDRFNGLEDKEVSPEITTPLVHELLTLHYTAILDAPVLTLGYTSPRAAAKSKAGREKVAEWLKHLEYQSRGTAIVSDPMATYDFTWIWRELEVEELRR